MSFESLGLAAELLRALSDEGYTKPTAIQKQAIPVVLEGRDVLAAAQTGTGKTAGFTLPLLQRLARATEAANRPHQPRALILTPTRELAAQVGESVSTYGRHLSLRSAVIFGGVKINPQITALKQGVDILVATPGRLLDHVQQRTLDLSRVEILVLDEADRMLDMGFIHDIRKVLALLPEERQNLLFSATFSAEIRVLADRLLDHPVSVEVSPRNTPAESVAQVVHPVDKARKRELLSHLIGANNWRQVLVFTRTKHGANRLAKQLVSDGLSAAAIHGNKTQGARTRALAGFKDGSIRVLVATDIAARGLDIDQLPHVVNFELPNVPEDYVHRIGRTGRAGNEGEAMSLVCVDEHKLLRDIERLLGRRIHSETLPGYEPDPGIAAEPIQNGRNRGGRGTGGEPRQRGNRAAGQGKGRPRKSTSGGNSDRRRADGSRSGPAHRSRSGDANRRDEPDGNRAQGRTVAAGSKPDADGNRKPVERDIDGNRAPTRKVASGNRAPGKRNNERGPRRRREKPALLGG